MIMLILPSIWCKLGLSSQLQTEDRSKTKSIALDVAARHQKQMANRDTEHGKEIQAFKQTHYADIRREMSYALKDLQDD